MEDPLPTLTLALTLSGCGWFAGAQGPPPDLRCDVMLTNDCFVRIPGGSFLRGAQAADPSAPGYDPAAQPDEGPVREVRVSSFWMQRFETSQSTLAMCVDQGACPTPEVPVDSLRAPAALSVYAAGVTWAEADATCRSLGARLPTEAEWEYAARGVDGRRFPWGDTPPCGLGRPDDTFEQLPVTAWARVPGCQDAPQPTNPRGRTPEGLRDLAWGSWEWVADWYAPDAYATAPMRDPQGPDAGERRVQRGGAWSSLGPDDVRSTARGALQPGTRAHDVGFRCAW